MIEKIILDYLSSVLAVPCVMEVPEPPAPEQYVVIEKTGSFTRDFIPSANIAVQSCAPSLLAAAMLNEEVKAKMPGLLYLPAVSACRLDTDYNFTDPSSKTYRYQAIFKITYMEGTP